MSPCASLTRCRLAWVPFLFFRLGSADGGMLPVPQIYHQTKPIFRKDSTVLCETGQSLQESGGEVRMMRITYPGQGQEDEREGAGSGES